MIGYHTVVYYSNYYSKKLNRYFSPQSLIHYLKLENIPYKIKKKKVPFYKTKQYCACFKEKDVRFIIDTYLI